ncbi:hypothetical protein DM02DRAFT_732956 [Periconia macrospinosa]|uniref:Extracellular membrane protein CFEM domain-containing protein n=1 Tax=Periconia macrospinosa TaxID=97972 RepID=A0A2V1D828_9PLEO|nr:hypothetical protein DM02DRAFT_732956 [Periconia macrospinosa]
MRTLLPTNLLSLLFLLLAPLARAQIGTAYQDVTTMAAYASLKPCAQNCFIDGGFCPYDLVGSKIGCKSYTNCKDTNWQATNDCYCRSDLQKAAQDYLTSCVEKKCTVGDVKIDGSAAGGIYRDYCGQKGYTSVAAPASVSATATKAGTGASAATAGSNGPAETGSSSSSSSSGSGSGSGSGSTNLSTGTIIGIAVGGLAGLILLSWIIKRMINCCTPNPGSRMPPQQQQPLPYYQQPRPAYPMNLYPEQPYWQHKTESEIGPDDSVSVVTPPAIAPTMVSHTRR